jgi:predicted DNA-binding transcriptional regulator AlpA
MKDPTSTATAPPPTSCLLNVKDVARLLAVSTRFIWRATASGTLPAPVRLAPKVVRWKLVDIQNHIDALAAKGNT